MWYNGRYGAVWRPREMRFPVVLPLLTTLATMACQREPRLGVVLPETGSAAVYGASVKTGISLALAGHRKAGGRPVEVWYRDSGSDPARAASACEALLEQGAALVIGGATSAEAKAMIGVADRIGRVLLSPSASAPDLTGRSDRFFRVYPSDELEGVQAAEFLVEKRNARSVLILSESNEYARGLLPVFVARLQALGAQVVGPEMLGDEGWEGRVRLALAHQAPAGVYVCGYGEAITRSLVVLRAAGFRGTVCTTSAIHATALLSRLGHEAEGLFFPLATADLSGDGEPARRFITTYRQTYNLEPDVYASYGHDAALAALAALFSQPRPVPEGLGASLRALRGVRGVMGPLEFDRDGNIQRTLQTHWIRAGKVEVAPAAEAPRREESRP